MDNSTREYWTYPMSNVMATAATLALVPTFAVLVVGCVVGVLRLLETGQQPLHPGAAAWLMMTHCCAGAVWVVTFNVALGRPALEVLSALPLGLLIAPLWPMQMLQAFGLFGFAFN